MTDYSKPAPYDPTDRVQVEERRRTQAEHAEARRPSKFVAPGVTPPKPAEIVPWPSQPVDLSPAWTPTTSPSRDSVSAVDRARAVHIRAIPIYLAGLGVAIVALIMYVMTLWFMGAGGAPYALDRVLVFLGVLTVVELGTFLRLNKQEFDHSHAGVERLRVKTAGEIQLAIIEAETEIKLRALDAYLKLIGVRDE